MARLTFGAHKFGHPHADGLTFAVGGAGARAYDATVFGGCEKLSVAAGGSGDTARIEYPVSAVVGVTYYLRQRMMLDALPSSDAFPFARAISGGNTTIGNLYVGADGALRSSRTGAPLTATRIQPGVEFNLEISTYTDGSSITRSVFLIDGVQQLGVVTGAVLLPSKFDVGFTSLVTASAAGMNCYLADWALNDDIGPSDTSWIGSTERVALLKPAADVARGDWTGGTGGTTNLWDAIDNAPPVGVSNTSGTNTSQVRDIVNNIADPGASYDFQVQSYAEVGVPADATITHAQAFATLGKSSANGVAMSFGLAAVSNPPIAELVTSPSGSTAGTYPTNWVRGRTGTATAPTVTRATRPVLRVAKRTATTAAGIVCAAGLYVAYGSAPPPPPATRFMVTP